MSVRMRFTLDQADGFYERRDELVAQFAAWLPEPFGSMVDPGDLSMMMDWKWSYDDGDLGLWNVKDLTTFLLEWCPRKLMAGPDDLPNLPVSASFAMAFLAERGLLATGSDTVDQLTEHARGLSDEFAMAMTDSTRFGLAKSIFASAGVDDPSALDPEQLEEIINEFNALPWEMRRSITDPAMAAAPSTALTIGAVRLPTDAQVRESAASARVFEAFGRLSDYFAAPGKVLTSTGNLKIADARALSDLLGTSDVYEETFGDHTFRKRSAADFVELDHWQWWAREAGVLRRQHNRLISVRAWQGRSQKDPVAAVRRAFEVLLDFGVLSSYQRLGHDLEVTLDTALGPLLGRLLRQPEGYDDLLTDWHDLIATVGVDEWFPGHLGGSLDRQLMVLEHAGVVTQTGAIHTPRQHFGEDRSAGTVALTPVGAVIAVDLLRDEGVQVAVLPRTEELSAAEVAAVVPVEGVDPEMWWVEFTAWLDVQDRPDEALAELCTALTSAGPLILMLALGTAPESLCSGIEPVVRLLYEESATEADEVASVALTWLLERGVVDPADCDPDRLLDAMLDTLGVLSEGDDSVTVETLSEGRSVAEQYALLQSIAQRGRPSGERLLEAIGTHHPDKTVSKVARKELFRLRSRLASRR